MTLDWWRTRRLTLAVAAVIVAGLPLGALLAIHPVQTSTRLRTLSARLSANLHAGIDQGRQELRQH